MNSVLEIAQSYSQRITCKRVFFSPHIPPKKLRGAIAAYAPDADPAEVLALFDCTFFKNARAGALVTSTKLYGRNAMEKPRQIALADISHFSYGSSVSTDTTIRVNGGMFMNLAGYSQPPGVSSAP